MMELLAGPYTVARAGLDNRYTGPSDVNRAFWDDELGIGSLSDYTSLLDTFGYGSNYFVTQLDGTCGARGKAQHGAVLVDMTGQYEWVLYDVDFDPDLGSTGFLYGFDKQSGVYADKLIAKSTGIYATSGSFPQVRTTDRLIAFQGPYVTKRAIDGSDASWIAECTLAPGVLDPLYDYPNVPSVSRTKDEGVLCLIYPSGGILFYDVVAKQQVVKPWIPRIGTNNGAWYSVKYDIYISYAVSGEDWHVSVWANSVRPDSLGNPEAVTPLLGGKVTQVRAQLVGDHGEPCEGELISWSLTSGDGALTATQSTTDADGYAYIGYVAPITAGTAPTIQATAEF
ncbi:MAG: hypothetical protein ACXWIJ_12510 [Burkholderiales bacterium]